MYAGAGGEGIVFFPPCLPVHMRKNGFCFSIRKMDTWTFSNEKRTFSGSGQYIASIANKLLGQTAETSCLLLQKEEWDFLFLFQELFPAGIFGGLGKGGGMTGRGEKQLESFAIMTQSCLAKVQELTKCCMSVLEGVGFSRNMYISRAFCL